MGIIGRAPHWTRHQSCVLCVVGWSVCPRSTQRSVRLGRASSDHAWHIWLMPPQRCFSPRTTRSARPRPDIHTFSVVRGRGPTAEGCSGFALAQALNFLSFSFIFFYFLSFSFFFFYFLEFSFIFLHFLCLFFFLFLFFVECSKSDFFLASIASRFPD